MSGLINKLTHRHHNNTTTTAPLASSGPILSNQTTSLNSSAGLPAYSGLSFPYTGATAHPTYGYQRLSHNKKAERFELKAAEWERRGNLTKAQKNREKALRYRARSQPGYVKQNRPQTYYIDRANLYDQKALRYQQWGMMPQYQRYQGRSQRLRAKYNLPAQTLTKSSTTIQQPIQHATTHVAAPIVQETIRNDRVVEVQPVLHRELDQNVVHHIEKHYTETAPSMGGIVERQPVVQQQIHTNVVNEIQPIIHRERVVPVVERSEQHLTQHIVQPTIHTHEVVYERGAYVQQGLTQNFGSYQGLSFPYTGATNHSTYGYPRLTRDQKLQRFELKAAEWERRGNMAKAQKNRNKALRYRQMSQPGYVRQQRPQNYYADRANLFDQKALRYQQWGMLPQAQRYQGRSQRLRTKHGLPMAQNLGLQQQGLGQNLGLQQGLGQNLGLQQGLGQNLGLQQQGLGQQGLGLQNQNLGLQQQGLGQNISGLNQEKLLQQQQQQKPPLYSAAR